MRRRRAGPTNCRAARPRGLRAVATTTRPPDGDLRDGSPERDSTSSPSGADPERDSDRQPKSNDNRPASWDT